MARNQNNEKMWMLDLETKAVVEQNENKVEHFGLLFEKYIKWQDSKEQEYKPDLLSGEVLRKSPKMFSLFFSKEHNIPFDFLKNIYILANGEKNAVRIFSGSVTWRLIVGLGAVNPRETSMTLNHIYGVPYIPGSALKGAFRHFWIKDKILSAKVDSLIKAKALLNNHLRQDAKNHKKVVPFGFFSFVKLILESVDVDMLSKTDKKDLANKLQELENNLTGNILKKVRDYYDGINKEEAKDVVHSLLADDKFMSLLREYQTIFGTQNKRGEFVFFDVYPLSAVGLLNRDVMTPHFGDYYNKKENDHKEKNVPPVDYLNPNPIKFLTVKGVFKFIIYNRPLKNKGVNTTGLNKVYEEFSRMLQKQGVGAKTAVGYGRFDNIKDITKEELDKIEESLKKSLEEAKRKAEEAKKKQIMERLEKLPIGERIVEELKMLESDVEDGNNIDKIFNKSIELYNKIIRDLNNGDKKKAAEAIKSLWIKIGKWKNISKKQKEKVKEIKKILGE